MASEDNMNWKNPSQELPPQGKKILYFKKGDMYVVQRIGNLWLPIPFYDSIFAFIDPPDLWSDVEMPEGFTGKLMIGLNDRLIDMDTLEKTDAELYLSLVQAQKDLWTKSLLQRRQDSLSKDWEK